MKVLYMSLLRVISRISRRKSESSLTRGTSEDENEWFERPILITP